MAQPAATIGSLHVCPKTTGTVPHVGGRSGKIWTPTPNNLNNCHR
ncbi:hypothetical protein [Psychromonas arctica]